MAKPLADVEAPINVREFIQETGLTNVENGAKPLPSARETLPNIREFMLQRNSTDVKSMAQPLTVAQASLNIREFILERRLTNVKCGKAIIARLLRNRHVKTHTD